MLERISLRQTDRQTDGVLCNFAVCFIRKKDENYLKILSLGGSFRLFTSKGGEKIRSLLKK